MVKLHGDSIYLTVLERGDCKKLYETTDGHTRAVAAYLAGWDSVPV